MGGDSDFFASGVHDDLLTQLAQLQSIRVISRTSVLQYRDTVRNIREIGKALGADAILEGGVQSAGERNRINAQLIDARTDEHLWAQTFDRELSPANIFEVQTEIARAITSALHATLTTQESAQLAVMPTENMAAYRAYHRAMDIRDATEGFDYLDFRQALEEAVALDPSFTRAWAELVGILSLESFSREVPESLKQAEQALEQIRKVAPESADYLIAQAFYTYYILKDYELAHQQMEAALAMRPSDARIVEAKSWIERRMGDIDGRIESMRLAGTLDPRNPRWFRNVIFDWQSVLRLREHRDFGRWSKAVTDLQNELGREEALFDVWETHIANRDFEAAEALAQVMSERPTLGVETHSSLSDRLQTKMITAWFLAEDEQLAELLFQARSELEQMLENYGDYYPSNLIYDLALVGALEGNKQEAQRMVRIWNRKAATDLPEKFYNRHRICRVLGMAGATAAAVDCIRKGLAQPSLVMPFMEVYLPYYDPIRNEPEFAALLAERSESGQIPK
jgi:TolB-like protein